MSVVKLDDKQKNKSSYKRNDSESENDSDRRRQDGTDERDASGHNSKKRKNKNVSPKTDRFKVRSLREFGYSKEGR
jgi:hypothetical protein